MDGGDVASSSLEADMEEDLITAAFGPMGRLLRRLHSFQASSGYRLPEGISADEIRFLTEGLEGLYNHLKGLPEADLGASFTPKWWIKEVRELAYDTEDYLDEVSQSGAGDRLVVRRSVRLSTISRITSSKRKQSRPQIAQGFLELMARVDDARERCKSFHLAPETATEPNSRQASVSRHTPVSAASISDVHVVVDNGSQTVVGFEEPMKNLVNLLAFGDINQKQLKAVAILGLPGVGKTMVARILYHRYGGEFQCRAFIRVSRNPDMRRILTSIRTQIKAPSAHAFSDAQDLIDSIIKHLQGKRYFIIVDDLWTASVWNIISRAFPNGDCCSRILTTTQIEDVALACSDYESEYIYKMGPLNDGESRNLFFSSVFGFKGEGGCPKEFQVVADEIIRKCGGLPLSTVNVASLLGQSKRNLVMEQWEKVERSLPSNLRTNPTSQGMKDVLILIYNKLPLHLKTCLLYFGMYPEGHTIRKDDLVKQWAAESFVRYTEKGYFDELVRRGLVQPVDTNYNGEVLSCTVNHMVLDLIRYKSMEDNFITTINYTESTLGLPDKVRRLSVQFGGAKCAKVPESIRMSHVRSLLFCGFSKCVPSIPDYGLLQVLILYIWPDQDKTDFDLPIIGELFRLRYLKVECNTTVNLPDKIQGLRYLETLQLDARLFAVPSDIGHLETLQHLRLPSQADVRDLGRLTNLQDLHLTVCTVHPADSLEDNMKYLGVILEKLSNLKSVTLAFAGSYPVDTSITSILCDSLSNVSAAPAHLERLELLPQICIFPSLPRWFETLSKLCVLKIAVKELSNSDIDILKGLPALTALSLYIQTAPADRIVFGKAGFSALKYFKLRCSKPLLKFEADAMPNLRTLKLVFNAQEVHQHGAAPICIEHLAGLKEIFAKIKGAGADGPESALWVPVSNDPRNPKINEQLLNWNFFADEDTSMLTQEQEDGIIEEEGEVLEENTDGVTQCAYKEDGNSQPDNVVSSTSLESSPATSRRPLGREYGMTIFSTRVKAILKARPWLTSKATSEGRDGLLWWHDLLPCYAGEFSVATVQANNLLEDQFRIESSAPLGTFIGVFDGHGGPEAARFAADHLFPNLQEAFGGLGMTTKTIEKAFQGTEESFIELVSRLWMTKPTLAAVGSCCLVSIVHQRTLFVASLGDSRAVLGKVLKGKIFPEQLSSEHLVCHESIRKEIKAQHPNDPQIVMLTHNVWRVKGIIQLSRSIGDAYLKDQKFNREPLPVRFRLCEPFNKPILSASPSIVSRDLRRTDRFIIFASDGLWEHLSNEEAVKIVHSCPCAGIARSLIKAALREAARKRAMRYSDLKKIERGIRRHFHDDITVVVLFIDYDLLGENHAQERSLSIGSTLENPSLKK